MLFGDDDVVFLEKTYTKFLRLELKAFCVKKEGILRPIKTFLEARHK